jgi:ABC-type multidrug transport system fused ATPase/permease subunit
MFPNVMALLVINVYIWFQNPKMGAIITTGLIITVLVIFYKSKKLLKQSQEESQNYHKRSEKLNDIVFNHEHIQLNNTSSEKLKESRVDDRQYSKVLKTVILEGRNTRFLVGTISVIVFFLTTWILYRETSNGNYSKIKAGALVIVLLLYVDWTNQMGHFLPDILILMGKVKDSDKFLEKIIGVVRDSTRVKPTLSVTKSDIEIKNLQLTVGEKVIMDNFNLHVREKTKVGIYGKSGRGKSTLLKAIFNLFEPSGGHILIGGNNIKEYKPASFRGAVVYINQDTSLENTTIMKNLQIGNTRSEKEITEFIEQFDLMGVFQNGLQQPIAMNGKLISKGMQKVIFMTRGLLRKNAKIFLIDEPTTSVDGATKLKLIEAIRTVCENKTVICVSHDDDLREIMDVTIEI